MEVRASMNIFVPAAVVSSAYLPPVLSEEKMVLCGRFIQRRGRM
jgi:hypothetical protein